MASIWLNTLHKANVIDCECEYVDRKVTLPEEDKRKAKFDRWER